MNGPECVLECVSDASDMECMSARGKTGHGPIQTGDVGRVRDGNGESNEPHRTISETVPAPRDAVCKVRSVFCEQSKRA